MQPRKFNQKALLLAAALAVAVLTLLVSLNYAHVPLVFFPFFIVWSWQGRRSEACRRRPEFGTCAPHRLLMEEDRRG